jgi:hypothetical protein
MLFGYISGEWLVLSAVLILISLSTQKLPDFSAEEYHYIKGILAALVSYVILRLAGKTPIGISYESSGACSGHPLLSFIPAILTGMIWAM